MIDLFQPTYTMRQLAEATSASLKDIDNYVLHKHLIPFRETGRPRFTALQAIETDLISRLATLFKIPPAVGSILARSMLEGAPRGLLDREAAAPNDANARPEQYRAQATIVRNADGSVDRVAVNESRPDAIDIIVPVQLFARMVLGKLAGMDTGEQAD